MLITSCFLFVLCAETFGRNIHITTTTDQPIHSEKPLNLSPLIEKGEIDKARNWSTVDPTLFANVKSHAAFINVDQVKRWNLFFWFFPAEGLPLDSTPWVIWLQGGPGASSLFGLFSEIGPLQYIDGKVKKMPVSWGSNYSLLFIDNPVGAGFSYAEDNEYVTNQDQVGTCLLKFIQQFLEVFPELRMAPLFISGESYGGKYVPSFGHYIHNKNDSMPINLKGLAVGSGWTDPPTMLHFSEFSLQVGLTDPEQAKRIRQLEDDARKYFTEGNIPRYSETANNSLFLLKNISRVELGNYLLNDDDSYISQLLKYVDFVNRSDVRNALHVGNSLNFDVMNLKVRDKLEKDIYLSVKPWLEELLEHYGVMYFNGQLDIGSGYAVSVHTHRSLKWSGAEAYLQAERNPIEVYGASNGIEVIGFLKAAGNFMDVMVRGAGHLVPADQPGAAKHIIDMFIKKFK